MADMPKVHLTEASVIYDRVIGISCGKNDSLIEIVLGQQDEKLLDAFILTEECRITLGKFLAKWDEVRSKTQEIPERKVANLEFTVKFLDVATGTNNTIVISAPNFVVALFLANMHFASSEDQYEVVGIERKNI